MLTPELFEAFESIAANWYTNPAAGLAPWIATDDKSAQDTASLLFALLEPTSKPFPKRAFLAYALLFEMSLMRPWNQLIVHRPDDQTIELNPTLTQQEHDELFAILRRHLTAIA